MTQQIIEDAKAARIAELEAKLNLAREAFNDISGLAGNPKADRQYDLIWEKCNEALKQIGDV